VNRGVATVAKGGRGRRRALSVASRSRTRKRSHGRDVRPAIRDHGGHKHGRAAPTETTAWQGLSVRRQSPRACRVVAETRENEVAPGGGFGER